MIRSISIKNYRCLRDVRVELGPLTALVGPNASGKSAILRALGASELRPEDVWRRAAVEVAIDAVPTEGPHFEQRWATRPEERSAKPRRIRGGEPPFRYSRHHFDLSKIRARGQLRSDVALTESGDNLANVFFNLPRREQTALASEFCELAGVYTDVGTHAREPGTHALVFQDRWHPTLWFESDDVSDGTLFLLAILTLTRQQPPVDVIAIEEPERGLHPYLLRQVVERLRGLAEGRIGSRPVQIILATHSSELLNLLRPEEVRFLRRSPEDGSTIVETCPTTSLEWERAFAEYGNSLSEAWLSGALGGVPGASP